MEGTTTPEEVTDGWTLVHEQPEETVTLSETQGRTQYNPPVLRAEKQINGTLVNVEAPTQQLLEERIAAVEATVASALGDPVAAEAPPLPTITRAVLDEDGNVAPEEVEVNTKTVITADGAFTEDEWTGRQKTDTIVTGDGQTVFSGVGDTEAIDEALAQTAEDSQVAENEATTDPHADVETQQVVYDTADAIDSPGQSAGGTLVIPADVDDLEGAIGQMSVTSQDAENERVLAAGGASEEEAAEAGRKADAQAVQELADETAEDEEPKATAAAEEVASELGIDLNDVEGTGKDGKITKADVEQYDIDNPA